MIKFLGTISLIGIILSLIFGVLGFIGFFIGEKQDKDRRRKNGLDV